MASALLSGGGATAAAVKGGKYGRWFGRGGGGSVGWSRCMRVGFCVRCICGVIMARGVSFFRVFRGGIGSCMCFWWSSVGFGVRGGFGAVSLVRFRSLVAVLGCIISIRSSSSVLVRSSRSGCAGSGSRSSGSCGGPSGVARRSNVIIYSKGFRAIPTTGVFPSSIFLGDSISV